MPYISSNVFFSSKLFYWFSVSAISLDTLLMVCKLTFAMSFMNSFENDCSYLGQLFSRFHRDFQWWVQVRTLDSWELDFQWTTSLNMICDLPAVSLSLSSLTARYSAFFTVVFISVQVFFCSIGVACFCSVNGYC